MTVPPNRLYVSYLSTDTLITCLDLTEQRLFNIGGLSVRQREVLTTVRDDLLDELERRQLQMSWKDDA